MQRPGSFLIQGYQTVASSRTRCLQDIQILAAQCFCQLLRLYAPDTPPYSTGVLAEMFAWFLVVFRRLESVRDPNFGICHSVLVLAAKVFSNTSVNMHFAVH